MNQAEFNWDAPPKKEAAEVPASLLDKIKKLLRLASSSNPHEAALAMSRAMAMADRANLDLSSLRDDDEVGEIVERWIPVGSRISREESLALAIVQTFFNVNALLKRHAKSIGFIGTDTDIAIAEYVFAFLVRTVRDCLATYETVERAAGRRAAGVKRTSYLAGFFYGVAARLKEGRDEILLEDQKFAIVLADQATARAHYAKEKFKPVSARPLKKHRRIRTALESGYVNGRQTRISPALAAKDARLALTEA